jgi:thiamine kinase-like enzyme
MELVADVLHIPESEITDLRCLKAGMTNKSFLFRAKGRSYICRIPGPGTGLLINRKQEKNVYDAVKGLGITEHVVYMSGDSGYKISEYYEGVRTSNPRDWDDVERCMELVKKLHNSFIRVGHKFDIRERIEFYESICDGYERRLFEDYGTVKAHMVEIMNRLGQMKRPSVLSHIDSVCDNFLFLPNGDIKLIDWEYAGMCDPLIDVSMCAIYSYYNEEEVEKLIRVYLGHEPSEEELFVYYAYIALGGFLWCLWAVYKSSVGEEFGDYTLVMYRYAKKYYKKLMK